MHVCSARIFQTSLLSDGQRIVDFDPEVTNNVSVHRVLPEADIRPVSPDHAPRVRFCASGERTRADGPSGEIGVRTLVMQRVWG